MATTRRRAKPKPSVPEISMVDPALLVPYAKNAKTHSDAQIDAIARSIDEFGFNAPVLVDAKGGVIAGHGRLRAALQLGMKEVPTICLAHLTAAQKRAYILADNRLGEIGVGWDFELVAQELQSLGKTSLDVSITGFDLSFLSTQATDPMLEWSGMPEYNKGSTEGVRKLVIHFESHDDVAEFCSLIGQTITDRTLSLWFPEKAPQSLEGEAYVSEA